MICLSSKVSFKLSLVIHIIIFFTLADFFKELPKVSSYEAPQILLKFAFESAKAPINEPIQISKVKSIKLKKNKENATSNVIVRNEIHTKAETNLKQRTLPLLTNGDVARVPYPEKAKQMMIEGKVLLYLTINEHGKVIDAKVLSGPEFGLRQAALKLAKKLNFLPATDEYGQEKIAGIEHEVVFRLNRK